MKKIKEIIGLVFWGMLTTAWFVSVISCVVIAFASPGHLMIPVKVFVVTSSFVLAQVIFEYMSDKVIRGIIKYKEC